MKATRNFSLWSLVEALVILSLSTLPARATILTFTITPTPPNNTSIETTFQAYGDNVNSLAVVSGPNTFHYLQGNAFTPNIALTYSHLGAGNQGHSTWTDAVWVSPVDFLHSASGSQHFYTFTPTAGLGVILNSFVIDMYSAAANRIDWNIRNLTTGGTILASGSELAIAVGANRNVNLGGFTNYNTTVLEINLVDVTAGHVGIDNLNFDQAFPIPEPSTLVLLSLGVTGLWVRRRCRAVE